MHWRTADPKKNSKRISGLDLEGTCVRATISPSCGPEARMSARLTYWAWHGLGHFIRSCSAWEAIFLGSRKQNLSRISRAKNAGRRGRVRSSQSLPFIWNRPGAILEFPSKNRDLVQICFPNGREGDRPIKATNPNESVAPSCVLGSEIRLGLLDSDLKVIPAPVLQET